MSALDLLVLVITALALLAPLIGPRYRAPAQRILVAAALLTGLAHLVVEGVRWQMVPAYIVLVAMLVRTVAGARSGRRVWLAIAALLLLVSVAASNLFPMFRLPQPTGPFAIGTQSMHLIDPARDEPHTVEPFDRRELMVRVWYPAGATAGAKQASYMDDAASLGPAIAKEFGLPLPFVFDHLDRIPAHSYWDVPVSDRQASYPVLVFSHGREIYAGAYTVLMEALASHGYVVFAIDHTYGSSATRFPDGRIASFVGEIYEASRLSVGPPSDALKAAFARANKASSGLDSKEIAAAILDLDRLRPDSAALNHFGLGIWSADQRFVLDEIEKLQNGTGPFAGRLDLSRLGVLGMSYGGSATTITCSIDPRCKAGVDLDGFAAEQLKTPEMKQPLLVANNGDQSLGLALVDHGTNWRYWIKVNGSKHGDYTDLPLVTRLWKLVGMSGAIEPQRMLSLVDSYVLAFFDKHLLDKPAPLLNGPSSQFPEVNIRVSAPEARGS